MTKPKLIICQGLPASGKTTWAKEQLRQHPDWMRVNRDDIRAMLYGTPNEPRGRFNNNNEKLTRLFRDGIIRQAIDRGRTIICDDTNLVPSTLDGLRSLVGLAAEIEIKSFLDVPLHECIARDEKRQYPVGASVIRKMWQDFIFKPTAEVGDATLPVAVVCDLDGTLAILNGRNPYDTSTCEQDGVNESVLRVLNAFKAGGVPTIFVSGRQQKDRDATIRFLARYGFGNNILYMRQDHDTRNDAVVKKELYDSNIAPHWNIELVIDDRDRVVDMWRGLGLQTWQVEYGLF